MKFGFFILSAALTAPSIYIFTLDFPPIVKAAHIICFALTFLASLVSRFPISRYNPTNCLNSAVAAMDFIGSIGLTIYLAIAHGPIQILYMIAMYVGGTLSYSIIRALFGI